MKSKVLAFVCVWSLLLSLLAVPAFAVKENYVTLKEVKIAAVASPAAGTEPLCSAETQTAGTEIGAVEWYQKSEKTAAGTKMQAGDKFTPGYYYTVTVTVNGIQGASFKGSGGVTATVNGKSATVTGNEGQYNADSVKVSHTFDLCMGTVSKFDVSLTAPVAGAAPSYTQVKGTGYETNNSRNNGAAYRNGIYWSNDTDNKVLYPDENPTFEAGKKYTAHVVILTTTGYKIASSYTVTVNGKTVTSNVQKVDNECLSVDYTFTVPQAQQTTSSDKTPSDDKTPSSDKTPAAEADKAPSAESTPSSDKTTSSDQATSSGKPSSSEQAPSTEETPEDDVSVQGPAEDVTEDENSELKEKEKNPSNTGLIIAVIVLSILLAGGGAFGVWWFLKTKKDQ